VRHAASAPARGTEDAVSAVGLPDGGGGGGAGRLSGRREAQIMGTTTGFCAVTITRNRPTTEVEQAAGEGPTPRRAGRRASR
jgi:hypothetical protein